MEHVPVLLNEVIKILDPQPGEFFIDGTLGGGGHAREIIKKVRLNPDNWLTVKNIPGVLHIVHRESRKVRIIVY